MSDLESRIHEKFDRPLSVQQTMINTLKEEITENRKKIKNWPKLKGNLKNQTFPRFTLWLKTLRKNRLPTPTGPFKRESWKLEALRICSRLHWRLMIVRLHVGFMTLLRLIYLILLLAISLGVVALFLYLIYRVLLAVVL